MTGPAGAMGAELAGMTASKAGAAGMPNRIRDVAGTVFMRHSQVRKVEARGKNSGNE